MAYDIAESVALKWENISVKPARKSFFTEKIASPARQILKDVSGVAEPGKVLAILGPPGAGKTTLLNVLTLRAGRNLEVKGCVKANDRPVGLEVAQLTGYVQEDNLFYEVLTVREHLLFQAMLRLDRNVNKNERKARVNEAIASLHLTDCQNSRIGSPGEGNSINEWQRRRLSLASEILMKPTLLVCDEPTSGLDSVMARSVVEALGRMAREGRTVICTFRQPHSALFDFFDNLMMLVQGQVTYMGNASKAIDFVSSATSVTCPLFYNPAEYYTNCLSIVPGKENESSARIEKLCRQWKDSPEGKLLSGTQLPDEITWREPEVLIPKAKTKFLNQLKYVFWMSLLVEFRDRKKLLAKVVPVVVFTFFIGIAYLGQENDQKGVENINAAIFLLTCLISFNNVAVVTLAFPLEFPVIKRDYTNNMYSFLVYNVSKTISEGILFTLLPIVSGTIFYWMVGLRPDFLTYFFFCGFFIGLSHCTAGYLASAVVGNTRLACAVCVHLIAVFVIFGGCLLNDTSSPTYLHWAEYLSYFKYINSLIKTRLWDDFGTVGCKNGTSSDFNCRYHSGKDVLAFLNYSPAHYIRDSVGIQTLLLSVRFLASISLRLRISGPPVMTRHFLRPKLISFKSNRPAESVV